jgi:hypothetical protein
MTAAILLVAYPPSKVRPMPPITAATVVPRSTVAPPATSATTPTHSMPRMRGNQPAGDDVPPVAQHEPREQSGLSANRSCRISLGARAAAAIPRSVDRAKGRGVVRKIRRTDDRRRAGRVPGS